MIPQQFKLKNTVKYPTSLVFGGLSKLGLEIVDSLLEQGGYVIIVDTFSEVNIAKLQVFPKDSLVSFIDYTTIPHLDEELRRLDYVFFFNHESTNLTQKRSAQDLLKISNYIDTTLAIAAKFEAKFLLSTSIKAHQLNAYNEDFKLFNHEEHKTYTDAETQRHSESLVLEYIEKNGLDARIVRLAEIIGDGIDFSVDTPFTQLVLEAARGENLKLHKDGLESEWLVHILDAAYGIIKAQFSKNTEGKTFSISYENSFTHLSIAYKLQEESDAQEIEFVDAKDNLPSLKLYKPAPNLSTIGWSAKVPFEKAIKQSIAAAKIYMLESDGKEDKKNNISGKLKNFFALADNPQGTKDIDSESEGPISRLIAERKKQEELKKHSIELAAGSIQIKKKKKKRTISEKFNNWMWERFLMLGKSFDFLKNKSPLEFLGMMIFALLIVIIFFGFISPSLVFIRNSLLVLPEYNRSVNNMSTNNWLNENTNFTLLSNALNENVEILDNFNNLFNILALGNQNTQVKIALQDYSEVLGSFHDINYSLEPLKSYFNDFQGNLQLRTSTESYLSVTNTGVDYENTLLEFHDRYPYLQSGMQKYSKAIKNLRNINISLIPQFLQQTIIDTNNQLFELENSINTLENLDFFSDMGGVYSAKTYVVLLFDNTRPKAIGGEISAYAIFTVKNGSIIEITVKSPEETEFNFKSISTERLKEINATKYSAKSIEGIKINDLGSLINFPQYSQYISDIFKDTFSRDISGVIAINYSSLENIIGIVGQDNPIELNSTDFSKGTLLQNLTSVQDLNSGIDFKHKITAQLLSNALYRIFNNPSKYFSQILNIFAQDINNKNILISTPLIRYNKVVKANNFDADNISESDSYVKIGMNLEDNKIITNDKYPELNIAQEILINPEYKLVNILNIEFPLIGTSQEIEVCLPLRVSEQTIKVKNIPSERVVINSTQNEKCIIAKSITEREVEVTWTLDTSNSTEEKLITLGVSKVKGTNSSLDSKITIDSVITLLDSEPFITPQNNSLIFTNTLDSDEVITLDLQK